MSAAWEDMTDIERASALELMGGKRQANILSSIISNFQTVEDVIVTSSNASGSALAENEKYLDSVQGKIDQFKNSLQTMWMNFIDSDVLKFIIDLGNGILKLVDTIGLIPTAAGIFATYKFAAKGLKEAFDSTSVSAKTVRQELHNYLTAQKESIDTTNAGAAAAEIDAIAKEQDAAAITALTGAEVAESGASTANAGANQVQAEASKQVSDAKNKEKISVEGAAAADEHEAETSEANATANISQAAGATGEAGTEIANAGVDAADGAVKIGALAGIFSKVTKGAKVAGTALKALGAAIGKAALVMLAVKAVSLITERIVKLINASKEAKKAAEEALSEYNRAQDSLKSQKQTIDELAASYEKLSRGVNLDTNENINLTTDSYKEYLDVCNDIADMYPNLVVGFDAQGNAILSLKGNVDELIQSYKDAAQAARQQMIASGGDVFKAFKDTYDNDSILPWKETGMFQQLQMAKKVQEVISNNVSEAEVQDFFDQISREGYIIGDRAYYLGDFNEMFKSAGIDISDFRSSWDGSIDLDKFKQQSSKLLSFIKSTTTQINTETSKVKSLMDAYLGEDLDYAGLSERSRAYVDQIVSSLDAEFINGFDSADELFNYIKTNIISAFQDSSVVDTISKLSELQLDFSKGNITYSEYQKRLQKYISQIQNKVDKDTLAQIKIGIGIDEESLDVAVNHITELLHGKDFVGPLSPDELSKIGSLSAEDLKFASELEVPEGTLLTWDQLLEKIKEAKIAATEDFDITNYTDSISDLSSTISKYQEALQKLGKGSFTMDDFMELIKINPELAKGVDISSNAFTGLSINLNRVIKTSIKSFIENLKELKKSLEEAGKSTESIDQLIEAVENMPDDALDNTINKYSTLADEIDRAKVLQNELAASMEENSSENYETRGEAIEYMKDLMEKGKIGSESNLWNVAEKYGFTYDSSKSINENADALAKFIAVREQWFAKDDDGNYTFAGTEEFIQDVEKAVKNSPELQELMTWTYDENTGTLDFDYDNENLKKIVGLLGQTKDLAGLTSEEFSDMIVQIGQYFGIDWGNYDDVLDYLNKVSTGTSDAKTKVEEYGKKMQEYFGEDSSIDLTTRPVVGKSEMESAGWKGIEEDYATVYSSAYSSKDGKAAITVTPILPDGEVLSPEQLEKYATEIVEGADPATYEFEVNGKTYTGEDIVLAKHTGKDPIAEANAYGKALHEAQQEYDKLRDPLNINATISESGVNALSEIEEIQDAISKKSDGTVVINEEAFREALSGAEYTEDQIDLIIEKIKELDKEAFNIDPLNINKAIDQETGTGIEGLLQIKELQDAIKQDSETGITVIDTDAFTKVLTDAGYTEDQIDSLIKKIQEYDSVISTSGNTDPLGLSNTNLSIDTLKASLSTLGIEFNETLGTWFDGEKDLKINVTDLVTTLKEKGWTDEAIKSYCAQLSEETNIEGFNIEVEGIENIDEVIAKSNEVPEEESTQYEVTGDGVTTLQGINDEWAKVPTSKSTEYTITETTVKKTEDKSGGWLSQFLTGGWGSADGTAHVNGTAFKSGSWGAPETETALVGELGPELLVRNGRWTTVGENGAEFTEVKKGDIIFNHKQTEELLSNGYVTSRGKAYASGTAYAVGGGTFARYDFSGEGGYTKYDVNDKVVDRFENTASTLSDAADSLSDSADSLSDATDEFEEVFDWVEVRLEEIDETLDLLDAKLENAASYSEKRNIIDEMIGVNNTKLENLKAGYKEYSEYADKLLSEIPDQYKEAAKNGSIAIEKFVGEVDETTLEAIKNYREWGQKAADTLKQIEEVNSTVRDLAIQKFDEAKEAGDVRIAVEESQTEKLQNAVDFDEARGVLTDPSYYVAMMENSTKKIEYQTNALNAAQAEFDKAVQNGQIKRGSNEWYETINTLYEMQAVIDESTKELEEFQNAINDIYWDNFDELINRFDYISDEEQSLIDLMDSADMVSKPDNENGWSADEVEWTKEGLATLGLHTQKMEEAESKAQAYAVAIDDLTKEYEAGHYSESEYLEKLNELKQGQYDAIKAAQDEKDAIVDIQKARVEAIKEGIEKEIDAYEELINKKKEELSAEKDLHDFQKSVADQQKDIADIQRKLAALAGDNSASAVAQRKKLQAELAEAQADLNETYYDRSVSDKQDALDKDLENFKDEKDKEIEEWDKYLENIEQIVAESVGIVQANAAEIGATLTDKAEEFNLTVSDAVLSPWRDGATAISDYTTTFGDSISSTTSMLDLLKEKWEEINETIRKANEEADKYYDANNAGNKSVDEINKENEGYAKATENPPKPAASTGGSTNASQPKAPPSVGSTVRVKSSATHFSAQSGNLKMASFVPGGSYQVMQVGVNGDSSQILIGKNGQYTGWVWLKDLEGYAKGTKGVKKDQWAILDELGEELQLVPDGNGRLAYMKKGTSVLNNVLTERLMNLAMNPQEMIEQNRPAITPSKSIVNNEINLDCSVGTLVNIEHCDQSTLPDVEKIIKKELDKHMIALNNSLKRYTR